MSRAALLGVCVGADVRVISPRSWVKDHRQVYLIGNPFVWALSTIAVLCYVAVRGLLILRAQRGYKDFANCA